MWYRWFNGLESEKEVLFVDKDEVEEDSVEILERVAKSDQYIKDDQ